MVSNKKCRSFKIILLLSIFVLCIGNAYGKDFKIDTPQKAIFAYFPSPATLRCLNHAELIKKRKKAEILRETTIDGVKLEESISVFTTPKLVSYGNINLKDLIIPLKINTTVFNKSTTQNLNPISSLQELIGIQKKIIVKDKIGNQELNYVTEFKNTKGKVGKENYNLEITGKDLVKSGKVKYIIFGMGNLGIDSISVSGQEIERGGYILNEQYGKLKIQTKIKVY